MAYSKRYQEVIAGRVREDELAFFKNNAVALPPHVFTTYPASARKQPTVDADYLATENVGKNTNRTVPVLSTFNAGSNNSKIGS